MSVNSNYLNRILLICLISCSFPATGFTGYNLQTVGQWQRWQYTLTSQNTHDRQPVSIDVAFSGSGGRTFHTPAYSDDDKIFHFYAAFPSSGIWSWKTTCSDPGDTGLHNKEGKVEVKTYKGNNPLYRHGDLKISDDRRYLVHADGTPFLWIGETAWYATWKATMKEWRDYVDIRAGQRFSVLQISPIGSENKNTASASENMSVRKDGTPDPLFWKELEDKIAYANDKGLLVFIVGVGKAWRDLFAENTHNQPFEAYIAGRFAGFMISFSPSFDELYNPANDSIAMELKKLTLHLVTQHPGTNYEANLKYRNVPSVDFCGLQSGHHGGNLIKAYNAARSWTLDMWNGSPVKPVIDIEAMYDAYGNDEAKNWREKDARKLGWIAWLSGSRGYTYGAGDVPPKVPLGSGGVWSFNKDSSAYDYWRKAVLWPSSGQMTIMRNFFASIEWWRLVPSHELIQNQPEDETLKMVVSIAREDELLLAYLPDNNIIKLDLTVFSGSLKGKWLNPVTGNYISIDRPVIPASGVSFSRPEGWEDAILFLKKSV
jgi:hypothetical protein